MNDKCNCGRDARYSLKLDGGEIVGSCNKYGQCPTYAELEKREEHWRKRAKKAEAQIQILRKILTLPSGDEDERLD